MPALRKIYPALLVALSSILTKLLKHLRRIQLRHMHLDKLQVLTVAELGTIQNLFRLRCSPVQAKSLYHVEQGGGQIYAALHHTSIA
jgi:hypothetical protein